VTGSFCVGIAKASSKWLEMVSAPAVKGSGRFEEDLRR
jgi:hypothetical protein